MAKRNSVRDLSGKAPGEAKELPTMREWLERAGKLEPVATERSAAQVIREERDRLGYERWPQSEEEFGPWEAIAVWPEEESGEE